MNWKKTILIIACLLAGAYFLRWEIFAWLHARGDLQILANLANPVSPYTKVEWQQGPQNPTETGAQQSPNIILILVDDLGWNDISFYREGLDDSPFQTPNIDSIAEDGVHFPRAYTASATCSPSRAAVMTGRNPMRSGMEFTAIPTSMAQLVARIENKKQRPHKTVVYSETLEHQPDFRYNGLPTEEILLPEILKQKGYHSIMLGKWHLGEVEGQTPTDQGFDEFLGFLGGAASYAEFDSPNHVKAMQAFDPIDTFLWKNVRYAVQYNDGPSFKPNQYMTDYLSEQAVTAIEANKNRPFFMYLAYNAPHTPLHASQEDYDALSMITDHTERVYGAMIRSLDRGIGQVLKALRDNGIEENTLVLFVSDNGAPDYLGLPDVNKPYRGWKRTFFEGGIRTPFFIKWPQSIPRGSQFEGAVGHIDIFSTAASAAGASLPDDRLIDGVDLLSFVRKERQGEPHQELIWRSGNYQAVLADGWKLQLSEPPGKAWLFNLNVDHTEQHNLAEADPENLQRMLHILKEGMSDAREPLWPLFTATPITIDKHLNEQATQKDEVIFWGN